MTSPPTIEVPTIEVQRALVAIRDNINPNALSDHDQQAIDRLADRVAEHTGIDPLAPGGNAPHEVRSYMQPEPTLGQQIKQAVDDRDEQAGRLVRGPDGVRRPNPLAPGVVL